MPGNDIKLYPVAGTVVVLAPVAGPNRIAYEQRIPSPARPPLYFPASYALHHLTPIASRYDDRPIRPDPAAPHRDYQTHRQPIRFEDAELPQHAPRYTPSMYVTRPDHLAPDRHDDRAFGPSRPARITTAPRLSLPATSQYRLGQPPTFRPVAYNHFGHFSPQLGNAQYPQVFGHSASGERKRAPASQYEERYMGEDENEEEQIEEDDEEDDLEERGRRSVANHSWTPKHHYFSVRYVDEWMTRNGRRPAYDDYREFTSALWEEFKYTKVLKGQELIGPTRSRASKREFWFPNRNHNMVHSHFNKTWKDELEKMCERHFGVGDERMISKQQKKRPPEDEGEPRPVKKRPEGSGGGAGLGRLWNNPA